MSRLVNFNKGIDVPTGGDMTTGIFSRVKNSISGLSTNTILIIVVALLFLGLGIYYYVVYKSKTSMSYQVNHELNNSEGKNAELLFFHVSWCPHCKTAKPIFEELKSEYANKVINGYKVIFTDVDCTNETPEIEEFINKYNIEGYPTIKLLKDNQVIEYDANPSKNTLVEFLNTVL